VMYCDRMSECGSICLFVCLHVSKATWPHKILYTCYLRPGLLILWRQCIMLCTSGFVDDVIFSHNGANSDTGDVAKYSLW